MDSCEKKRDIVHYDYMSALVASYKITYASAGLIGLPWQCCPSSSMSNQRPRFTENFQSGTLPCACLSVLICDISISWTFFLLNVENPCSTEQQIWLKIDLNLLLPPETESSDWFYSALMISDT